MCQLAICSYDRVSTLRAEKTEEMPKASHNGKPPYKKTCQHQMNHLTRDEISARLLIHTMLVNWSFPLVFSTIFCTQTRTSRTSGSTLNHWNELVIRRTKKIINTIDDFLAISKNLTQQLMEISSWSKWSRTTRFICVLPLEEWEGYCYHSGV